MKQLTVQQWTRIVNEADVGNERAFYFACKRYLDVFIAATALFFIFPFYLVLAFIIKLDSRGPVFFIQERVGAKRRVIDGQVTWEVHEFPMYKFRTMYVNAESEIHRQFMEAYIAGDEAKMAELQPNAEEASSFKLSGDPRVTRVGKFLRKTSLDELPQLLNVVKGDMSLVGPRPAILYEVEMYQEKHFHRLAAIPGITGLWQVSGRCEIGFDEMIQLDQKYIQQQSLWLDIQIILNTFLAIFTAKGAG